VRRSVPNDPEAVLQRGHESAGRSRNDRPDVERHRDHIAGTGAHVREVDPMGENVDPGQSTGSRIPDRPLGELGAGIDDYFDANVDIHRRSSVSGVDRIT
jgi:hypothetical protein